MQMASMRPPPPSVCSCWLTVRSQNAADVGMHTAFTCRAGQSQPPNHLSMFLEVTDPRAASAEWSCFVSHCLSVVNQRGEERSVGKESQNRYSRAAKDWGWREFVTLTSLFDLDAGFLVNDSVVFSAEVPHNVSPCRVPACVSKHLGG